MLNAQIEANNIANLRHYIGWGKRQEVWTAYNDNMGRCRYHLGGQDESR